MQSRRPVRQDSHGDAGAAPPAGWHAGAVTVLGSDGSAVRGVVRLLNTADGRALCLAGEVDGAAVDSFVRRYGREPMRIDRIDAGSVTSLSDSAVDLVLDHLDAAGRARRAVVLQLSAAMEQLLTDPAQGRHSGR